MSILYRGPSIDASYQISDELALWFQRRRLKCEKLTDDGRRTPSDSKSSHCLWQGELKNTFDIDVTYICTPVITMNDPAFNTHNYAIL